MQSSAEVRCWCQHCGYELAPSHIGNCPQCGQKGKRCEVHAIATIGISATATALLTRKQADKIEQILDATEKPLWHKIVESLKSNVVIDGFEIGFPSGVKVIFKVKNKR